MGTPPFERLIETTLPVMRVARAEGFQQGGLDGTFWGVGEAASHYSEGFAGYSKGLAREVIAEIRTDLDAFADTEAAVLRTTDTFSPTRRCAGTWEASSPIPCRRRRSRIPIGSRPRGAKRPSAQRSPAAQQGRRGEGAEPLSDSARCR